MCRKYEITMKVDFSKLTAAESYRWLACTVTPRPIAWVSTRSNAGVNNLAPFSFFQIICDKPATLMVNIAAHENGKLKDTLNNIRDNGELAIQLVSASLAGQMNESSASLSPEISEFEHASIVGIPSALIKPLRVRDSPVSFECRLAQIIPYPPEKPRWYTVYADVLLAHIDDQVLDIEGRVDPRRLDVLGRLAGNDFCRTQEVLELIRPL